MIPKTYVVPLDGSPFAERAVPIAGAIAERVGGHLLLVTAPFKGTLEPHEYLAEVVERFPGVPIETTATDEYLPTSAIANVVGESDDRIVCMTSHGRGRLRWSMLGSTAEEVIRRSDRPILLVGRHCREDFLTPNAHMLACVDGSEKSERIAPIAREWAEQLGLSVDAAVVVHPRDVESAEHPENVIDPILRNFGGHEHVRAHLLTSSYVAGTLADFADDLPTGIIAMSSHGHRGLVRATLGSVTMAVLNLATCPLLVTHSDA
jgi:nucleotide-binding universal stress UspA family protein